MSCLNLKKLLPHKRVWKLLTNKLQFKVIRTKRPKYPSLKPPKKVGSLSIQPKKFKKQPNRHTIIHHKNHHCYLKRRPPPVFVDHLYVEPAVSIVEEHVVSPETTRKEEERDLKEGENLDGKCSNGEETSVMDGDRLVSADDAWESMVMGSPQMDEINKRADEFIARFRAQMRQQEILARRS